MSYIFFSLQNFNRDGGGSVRIYGILNELVRNDSNVVFISNASNFTNFDSRIKHIRIGHEINPKHKALIQGLTGILSPKLIPLFYPILFRSLKKALILANAIDKKIYFFEYLDNTVAYLLKKNGLIKYYVNDIHGIATTEFRYQQINSTKFKNKIKFYFKYRIAHLLDKKVFENATGLIFASRLMKIHYNRLYNIENKESFIIPNLLNRNAVDQKVDSDLKNKLIKEFNIVKSDFTFFFAGTFKASAGVQDLIKAFSRFVKIYPQGKLIIIGIGPSKDECLRLIDKLKLNSRVIIIERIPYEQLRTYQSLSQVIVCPDRQNPYSELIVHLKYFDSLASGRLVINGAFESVMEINKDNFLSPTFIPSDLEDLYETMVECFDNYLTLLEKFKNTRDFTLNNLTYSGYLDVLQS